MNSKNIVYTTSNISEYYRQHRTSWNEFYPSEKKVIDFVQPSKGTRVIDMGCACGGLGLALKEKYNITDYVGVDIHAESIDLAKELNPDGKFFSADYLEIQESFKDNFDLAFSLSCADWNVGTSQLLKALFSSLKIGGSMVVSCRLSNHSSVLSVIEARQKIAFTAESNFTEYAPYKVYTLKSFLQLLCGVGFIEEIYGYGYWGIAPETVENLEFKDIFYMVLSVKKSSQNNCPKLKLDISTDLIA